VKSPSSAYQSGDLDRLWGYVHVYFAQQRALPRKRKDGKPVFLWLNPTRMHVVTHLSPKYNGLRNSDNNWTIQEAGMAQIDDIVGSVMKYLKDNNLEGDTIIVSPSATMRKGDRVVVKTTDGQVMAKIMQRQTSKTLELASFNPDHATKIFDMKDVDWIARIMWASQ